MNGIFKLCVLLTVIGCAAWIVLHFSGVNLEEKLLGGERTIGADALHMMLGFAAVCVLYGAFRKREQ